MGYDRGDSFPSDFEPNENPFGSKSKEKRSPRSYPIQCERKWKHSFLSVYENVYIYICINNCTRSRQLTQSRQIRGQL